MPARASSALLLALATSVLGSSQLLHAAGTSPDPPSGPIDKSTLRIGQVSKGVAINAAAKVANDFAKWGRPIPSPVAAAAATQTGSVQATDGAFDFVYYAPVSIGGANFLLDFDTGSSDTWVFSKQLPAAAQKNHNIYQDTGTQITGETWAINYVDGTSAAGNVWADTVNIGGATVTMAVEAATTVPTSLQTRVADGFVGLAFNSINTCSPRQCNTFMTQLSPSLPKPLFTATLRHNKPGTYDFGFIDSSEYTGSIGYITADNSSGFWGLTASGYSIGAAAQKKNSFATIADTGTSLVYLPPAIVKAYYKKITGSFVDSSSQLYLFPCSSKVPNFSLYINGHKATVPGSYVNVGTYSGSNCLGSIQPDTGFPDSILGDGFLKSQFVVFNLQGPKLGFAQQAGIPSS